MREKSNPLPLWRGHRVFGVDGSKINVPHELLDEGYKAPNKYQYYPQGLMSTLYHLGSGLIYDGILTPEKSERACLLAHMDQLSEGDILVVDRGYFSYLVLLKAVEKGVHLICRMQSGSVNKAIKAFLDSDEEDKIITYKPSVTVAYESKKKDNNIEIKPVKLRLIKYIIDNETYVCSTTLLGEEYPLSEFPSVYHGRCGIEELYKISKSFIDVEDFHSKSERGVKQECYGHILLINLARIFEYETDEQLPPPSSNDSKQNSGENKDNYWKDFCGEIKDIKINFKNCLLVVGRSLEKLLFTMMPNNEKNYSLASILTSISLVRQKIRPGRHYPRQSRKPMDKWHSSNGGKVNYA
jgi:hypothetical protein